MAKQHADFVTGFIGAGLSSLPQLAKICPPGFLIFTPGVKLTGTGDKFGQQYASPDKLMAAGADLVVVGRDIWNSDKPVAQAKRYREISWKALQQRIAAPKVTA
jgi:orotidine-5'-phosphate decarboxylase